MTIEQGTALPSAELQGIPKSMNRYWKNAQTTHRLMYHLVLIPKYRLRVLKGGVADRLSELFKVFEQMDILLKQ